MAKKKRGLGRGLEALLGAGTATLAGAGMGDGDLMRLPVEQLKRGRYQPRMDINSDTLKDLADSIRAQGVVQPIVVRRSGESFEIVAGERRWRAAQLAGLAEIPAVIRDVDDRAAMSIALIENIQREELNPLDEAGAFHRLVTEFEMTHQEVAEAVGRSRAAVSNLMRLLELREDVKLMLEVGDIEMGHARALLALTDKTQSAAAREVVASSLSVRQTERLVRDLAAPKKSRSQDPKPRDPNLVRLEEDLTETLGAAVSINHGSKGAGTVSIKYYSLEELDGILAHIK